MTLKTIINGVNNFGFFVLSSPAMACAVSFHPSKTSVKLSTACDAPLIRFVKLSKERATRMLEMHMPSDSIYNGGHD